MNTDLSLLKILLLLSFWSHAGTTALPQHYRRKNGSFCLPEKTSPPHDISLFFEDKVVIKSNKTKNSYKDRVDYDKTTFKWCLHQLSETDSGIYKFAVTNNDRVIADGSLALVVEEAVPRPIMQAQALHSNLSAELCNVTINCSIWGDWVSAVCNGSVCQTSGQSLKTVNITVSAGYGSVICSGSNSVSTSNISTTICFNNTPGTLEEAELLIYVLLCCTVAFLLSLLAICAAALYVVCIKHQKDARPPQKIQPREAARAPSVSSRVSNLSGQSEVAYENVDAVSGGQDRRVDTTYGLVEGPHGALDGTEAQEAKNRGEVETVYSVLQKV